MTLLPRLAAVFIACLVSACAATTAGTAASTDGGAAPLPTFWPEGVPTPPPLRGAPDIGASEKGADALEIAYDPPHLRFSLKEAPAGTYSVIYLVASQRYKADKLQIDSVAPDGGFVAKLEYERLSPGVYTVRAYLKGVPEPIDERKITVP